MEIQEENIIEVDKDEVLEFDGPTVVGGLFTSAGGDGAASYLAGFIAHKLMKYHVQKLHNNLKDCETCSTILSEEDVFIHMFVSIKQYVGNVGSGGLKFCSEKFVNHIIELERYFLYFIHHHPHEKQLSANIIGAIRKNCILPDFCSTVMKDYFVNYYVKCRLLQSTKNWSQNLRMQSSKPDKLKKITSK